MLLPSEERTTENGLNTFVLIMAQVQARIWPRLAHFSQFDRQRHHHRGWDHRGPSSRLNPPWRQRRGKSQVNLPQMLPPGGSI
jgi:hypothetical protein